MLRSMRFGEADRILHLYTPGRGRIGAIAKGVRRSRSRFGGRLEPFFRVSLGLHEGRSDLMTVTSAETVAPHRDLRERADALDAAGQTDRAFTLWEDARARLIDSADVYYHFAYFCRYCSAPNPERALQVAVGHCGDLAHLLVEFAQAQRPVEGA